MDVFSTEQGIRLGFVKTSDFEGVWTPQPPPRYATAPKQFILEAHPPFWRQLRHDIGHTCHGSAVLFLQVTPLKSCMHFYFLICISHAPPLLWSLSLCYTHTLQGVHIIKLIHMQFSLFSCYFLSCGPNIVISTCSWTPSVCALMSVRVAMFNVYAKQHAKSWV
jgi:hypothetical protein